MLLLSRSAANRFATACRAEESSEELSEVLSPGGFSSRMDVYAILVMLFFRLRIFLCNLSKRIVRCDGRSET